MPAAVGVCAGIDRDSLDNLRTAHQLPPDDFSVTRKETIGSFKHIRSCIEAAQTEGPYITSLSGRIGSGIGQNVFKYVRNLDLHADW
jgi:hypothetical protein